MTPETLTIVVRSERTERMVPGLGRCVFRGYTLAVNDAVETHMVRPATANCRLFVNELVAACLVEPVVRLADIERLSARSRARLRAGAAEACDFDGAVRKLRGSHLSADERVFAAAQWRREEYFAQLADAAAAIFNQLKPLADSIGSMFTARWARSDALSAAGFGSGDRLQGLGIGNALGYSSTLAGSSVMESLFPQPSSFASSEWAALNALGATRQERLPPIPRFLDSLFPSSRERYGFDPYVRLMHMPDGMEPRNFLPKLPDGLIKNFKNFVNGDLGIAKSLRPVTGFQLGAFETLKNLFAAPRALDALKLSLPSFEEFLEAAEREARLSQHRLLRKYFADEPAVYIVELAGVEVAIAYYRVARVDGDPGALLDRLVPAVMSPVVLDAARMSIESAGFLNDLSRAWLLEGLRQLREDLKFDLALPQLFAGLEAALKDTARRDGILDPQDRFTPKAGRGGEPGGAEAVVRVLGLAHDAELILRTRAYGKGNDFRHGNAAILVSPERSVRRQAVYLVLAVVIWLDGFVDSQPMDRLVETLASQVPPDLGQSLMS